MKSSIDFTKETEKIIDFIELPNKTLSKGKLGSEDKRYIRNALEIAYLRGRADGISEMIL